MTDETANINIYPTGLFGVGFMILFALVIVIGNSLILDTGRFVIQLKEQKEAKSKAL